MENFKKELSVVCQNCYHTIGVDSHTIFSTAIAFGCWNEPYAYIDIKCPVCGEFHEVRVPILFGEPEVL